MHGSYHSSFNLLVAQAYSELGNISVSGVDGSFDILADRGTVRLQVNKLYPAKQHQIPGEDMYLEKDSPRGSYASAPEGHIIAVVDPEVNHFII
jgi:hypothetical protein